MLPHAKRLPTRSTDSEISRPSSKLQHSTQTLQNMPTQVYSHNDRTTRITQLHTSVDFSEEANSTGQPSQKKHMQIYMSVKKLSVYLGLGTYHSPQ